MARCDVFELFLDAAQWALGPETPGTGEGCRYESLSQALPVGRVGEVGDIAETFIYLMRNGYSSGSVVTVDGGSVLV